MERAWALGRHGQVGSQSAASLEEMGMRLEGSTSSDTLGKQHSVSLPPISSSVRWEAILHGTPLQVIGQGMEVGKGDQKSLAPQSFRHKVRISCSPAGDTLISKP